MQESRAFTFFYVTYYAYFAYVVAFFALRASDLGLSNAQLSLATGFIGFCLMLSPLTFQYLGEHFLSRQTLTKLGTLFAALFSLAHLLVLEAWLSIFCCAVSVFLARGSLCLVDGECVTSQRVRFEWVRGIGSTSFIFSVLALGVVFEKFGSLFGAALSTVFLLLAFCSSYPLNLRDKTQRPQNWGSYFFSQLSSLRGIAPLLIACFFSWLPQGAATAYFSVYLESLGWSKSLIGTVWAYSVTCEVLFFFIFPKIAEHLSLVRVLQISLGLGALRWVLTAVLTDTVFLFAIQGLHAFSFAGSYLACIKLVPKCLEKENWQIGQGWLTTFGLAPGSILGAFLGGVIVTYSDISNVFIVLGLTSLLGLAAAAKIRLRAS